MSRWAAHFLSPLPPRYCLLCMPLSGLVTDAADQQCSELFQCFNFPVRASLGQLEVTATGKLNNMMQVMKPVHPVRQQWC